MHRLLLYFLGLFAVTLVPAGQATAQDAIRCVNKDGTVSPEVSIAACSQEIASGKYKPSQLAVAYHARGAAHFRKGEFDRAIADLDESIRRDPKQATVYVSRGLIHWRMDNLDGALTDYTKAIQLDPKAATAYEERGRVHGRNRDFDRALADFDAAIRLNPKNAITYNNRGLVFRNKRQHARAIEDFDAALRLDPKYAVAYANRGLALEETNQLERALTDYRLAVSLNAELKHGGAAIKRVEQKLASATSQVETPTRPDAKSTPAFATVTSGPRVALVIGNGNYLHSERLVNPVNDATDIAQALRKLGFEVVEGHDLDKRGMEDKAREFGHKLERASLALFFYAGHGMQVAGRNYLIPVDSKLQRGGDLNLDTVDVSVILAQMEADQRVNLVFLDACRDNPLARSFARTLGARSTSVGQGLASIQSAIGTMIAYATQPDNVAFDGDGQRNSPFTSALLKHISTPGLEIAALMRRVRADVVASTRQKQVPWDHSSLIGDVILAR